MIQLLSKRFTSTSFKESLKYTQCSNFKAFIKQQNCFQKHQRLNIVHKINYLLRHFNKNIYIKHYSFKSTKTTGTVLYHHFIRKKVQFSGKTGQQTQNKINYHAGLIINKKFQEPENEINKFISQRQEDLRNVLAIFRQKSKGQIILNQQLAKLQKMSDQEFFKYIRKLTLI